jgi:phosphate transport system protein
MFRPTLERSLQQTQDEMLVLAYIVEHALVRSVQILQKRDIDGARRLIAADREVDKRRIEIEMSCLTLIATQQPMAGDLRVLAAILAIVGELERISDYAKGIARVCLLLDGQELIKPLRDIPLMADKVYEMLRCALDAFIARDAERARAICLMDDEVDALYTQIFEELMSLDVSHQCAMTQANYLLWTAHNLERAADRVTNICERIVYLATGELLQLGDLND